MLEGLLAVNLLAISLIVVAKVMIGNIARQQYIKQYRMAVLHSYCAQALEGLPPHDTRWQTWHAQLKHMIPDAKFTTHEEHINICWNQACVFRANSR